ncbi:MAG: hypothetical protein AAF682_01545 [Planctomycetota bacterium]
MKSKLASLLLALAALSGWASAQGFLPAPSGPLTVPGGEGAAGLAELAERYAALLGMEVDHPSEDGIALGKLPTGLRREVEVPAEAVHSFVQGLFCAAGYLMTAREGRISLHAAARVAERPEPHDVEPDDLAALAGYNALFVRLPATMEMLEMRQLAISLRVLARPGTTAPVLTVQGERTVVIEGGAEDVRLLWNLLRRVDADEPEPPAPVDWDALFPESKGDLTVEPDTDLLTLLDEYGALTGRNFCIDAHSEYQIARLSTGLQNPARIPAARVHAFVEGLLAPHGIGISILRGAEPSLHAVLSAPRRFAPRPLPVDPAGDDLLRLHDHPATLFSALLRIEDADVRQLTTSLRVVQTDTNTSAMLALDKRSLYAHAPGAYLGWLVEVLRSRRSRGLAVPAPVQGLFSVKPESGRVDLTHVLAAWSRATGNAVAAAHAQTYLLAHEPGAEFPSSMPTHKVNSVVQALLQEKGVALAALTTDPPLFTVTTLFSASAGSTTRGAVPLLAEEDELLELVSHPALLVSTRMTLKQLDPRRVSMELRGRVLQGGVRYVLALGERDLLIAGAAASVQQLVTEIRAADAAGEMPK